MVSFQPVHPGDPMQAHQVQQVIDALIGTPGAGVPLSPTQINDTINYALSVENTDPTNSRALNVMKSDGSVLVRADATGVTLGSPVNLTANSVAGSAIQDASVTNAKLGPDVARANLLTNGGFETWQRGTAGFTATGVYSADRWYNGLGGTSTFSVVQRETAAANVDAGSLYSLGFSYTHNAESFIFQKLEDFSQLKTRTITLSIRVRALSANMVRPFIQIAGGAGNIYGAYHSGGGAFETLQVTATGISATTTSIIAGVSLMASGTAYLDNACLVVGSQPANYVPLHPADDLARCLRYYEIIGNAGDQSTIVAGYQAAGGLIYQTFHMKTEKPVAPTVTVAGTWTYSNASGLSVGIAQTRAIRLQATVTALGYGYAVNQGANSLVTIEANV